VRARWAARRWNHRQPSLGIDGQSAHDSQIDSSVYHLHSLRPHRPERRDPYSLCSLRAARLCISPRRVHILLYASAISALRNTRCYLCFRTCSSLAKLESCLPFKFYFKDLSATGRSVGWTQQTKPAWTHSRFKSRTKLNFPTCGSRHFVHIFHLQVTIDVVQRKIDSAG
jgi:hypothetical protein